MLSVLFTSVGRRGELVRAFRAAREALGLEAPLVGIDVDPLAPALQLVDRPYIVPRIESPDFLPTLLEICRAERVGLVFPLRDPDITVLAAHQAALEAAGSRVAVVSRQAAAITEDKWLTQRFFEGLGLSTPRSWRLGELDPLAAEYPLFLKPRRGSASQSAHKIRDGRELTFYLETVPEPIVQEFLPGPEVTSDVVCSLEGEIGAVVSRRRIEVRSGEVAKGVTVAEPAIFEACTAIARALPAVGPITVQCLMKDGVPQFTEINARLGGGLPLGIAAGVDSPRWLLARAAGLPFELPPLGTYRVGLYMTRLDESLFLTEEQCGRLVGRRLRPR